MSEVQFKTVSDFVSHLETVDGDTVDKQTVIDVLKELATRKPSGQRRGQLAGLSIEEMSDEQLKRELINANSVLYKAIQRSASPETIEKNQARVDAAKAEKAKREPVPAETPATTTEATTDQAADEVYNPDVAAEL